MTKKRELQVLKARCFSLITACEREKEILIRDKKNAQLEQWLKSNFIRNATIPKIGSGRMVTLESYGIATAFDVLEHQVRQIPGFGDVLTENLLSWRRMVEQDFHFDPTKEIPASVLLRVEGQYLPKQQRLIQSLVAGRKELVAMATSIRHEFDGKSARAQDALLKRIQAEADLAVL